MITKVIVGKAVLEFRLAFFIVLSSKKISGKTILENGALIHIVSGVESAR